MRELKEKQWLLDPRDDMQLAEAGPTSGPFWQSWQEDIVITGGICPHKGKGVDHYCPPVSNLCLLLAKSSGQQLSTELRKRQPQWSIWPISLPDTNYFFSYPLLSKRNCYQLQINTFLLFIL